MLSQTEIREKVTNQIIKALQSGPIPFWRKPWSLDTNAGYPTNAVSRKPYRGINNLILSLKNFDSKWFATYNQWQSLGCQVRKGEKGTPIILFKPVHKVIINDNGEEEVQSFTLMRMWSVFHISQVDGDKRPFQTTTQHTKHPFMDYQPAEKAIAATKANIHYGGEHAFYSAEYDFIQMPPKESFQKTHEFYGTLTHELIHWTGHKSRLNRLNKLARFGNESYAIEELVAELGSSFLLAELDIPQSNDLNNITAYLNHWLKILKQDHTAIFTTASAASKAVDFILSFSQPQEITETKEEIIQTTDKFISINHPCKQLGKSNKKRLTFGNPPVMVQITGEHPPDRIRMTTRKNPWRKQMFTPQKRRSAMSNWMRPETWFGRWVEIEGPHDTEIFPYEVFKDIKHHYNGPEFEIKIIEGYGARFSAPGLYLDCTDWVIFDTEEEARKYLAEEEARYAPDEETQEDDKQNE
jgi:antirestriction protein ArdC